MSYRKNTEDLKYGIRFIDNPKEWRRLASQARRDADPLRLLLNQAKHRCKKNGMVFDITRKDLVIPEHCPVFGIELKTVGGKRTESSLSLDRLDNSKGYTRDNVRVISWKANMMKGNLTIKEVEALLEYMKGNTY